MNFRRAIRISIATYVATIAVSGVGLFAVGHPISLGHPLSSTAMLTTMIIAIVATAYGTWWYLRPADMKGGPMAGFTFGLLATVTAFVLDLVIALMLKMVGQDALAFLRDSYTHWFFGIMIIVGLALCTIVGASKTRHGY